MRLDKGHKWSLDQVQKHELLLLAAQLMQTQPGDEITIWAAIPSLRLQITVIMTICTNSHEVGFFDVVKNNICKTQ